MSIQTAREWRVKTTTGPSGLELGQTTVPQPGPDQVVVKMEYGSLQYRDLLIVNRDYAMKTADKVVPGSDGAGVVVAVGPQQYASRSWSVGDKVCPIFTLGHLAGLPKDAGTLSQMLGGSVDGVFREYAVFPANGLVKIPDNLSLQEASTLPCAALTAYNSLFGLPTHVLKAGQWVLIEGTGGVSIFGLQFALATGARAIVLSSSNAKLEVVKKIAGNNSHLLHTINYTETPDWDKTVREITQGHGVDHVIEVVGNKALPKALACLALNGHVGCIGFVGGANEPAASFTRGIIGSGAVLRGILIGSREQFEDMNRAIEATGLKPAIDKVFEFGQLPQAYEYLESQKHVGKVVVKLSS